MPEGTQVLSGGVRFQSRAGWLHTAPPPACTHPSRTRTYTQTQVHACTALQLLRASSLGHHAAFHPPCPAQSCAHTAHAQFFHMHLDRMENHSPDVYRHPPTAVGQL